MHLRIRVFANLPVFIIYIPDWYDPLSRLITDVSYGEERMQTDFTYDAWGRLEKTVAEGDETSALGVANYTGHLYDEALELYYAKARIYSPEIDRFLSEDPIRDGLNWYTYCGNNLVIYIDPSGLDYVIGWSYGGKDVKEYEQYLVDIGNNKIQPGGNASDWGADIWSDFEKRSSFARAAYTRRDELIKMGIPEDQINIQRIDSRSELERIWNAWGDIENVEGLDFYSHGYGGGAEVYGGSGNFWEGAMTLKWGSSLREITTNGKKIGHISSPYAAFYGCNTANGDFAQDFADTQAG